MHVRSDDQELQEVQQQLHFRVFAVELEQTVSDVWSSNMISTRMLRMRCGSVCCAQRKKNETRRTREERRRRKKKEEECTNHRIDRFFPDRGGRDHHRHRLVISSVVATPSLLSSVPTCTTSRTVLSHLLPHFLPPVLLLSHHLHLHQHHHHHHHRQPLLMEQPHISSWKKTISILEHPIILSEQSRKEQNSEEQSSEEQSSEEQNSEEQSSEEKRAAKTDQKRGCEWRSEVMRWRPFHRTLGHWSPKTSENWTSSL
eukprot:TRINITY_DN872_c0_g1_i1.p1 TRINITY_DN872_c0_g1~~TRINITY_DN872_c0_g1_i1.p1  ORF type:complete len:257 (-),score=54.28 TRINITY_DN872_c0_g1_i1:151-921(-)